MGFLDKVKKGLGVAKDKADDLAEQHGDKIKSGIDKAADVAGKKMKGKSGQVDKVADKAKGFVDDLAKPEGDEAKSPSTSTDAGDATPDADATAADQH